MDLIFHILLPLLLLKFSNVESKFVYWLLPLAVIFDLGKIVGMQKELNSIFVALLVLFVIYLFVKRSGSRNSVLGISAFYLFSHILLDLVYYQQLFWPFVKTYYWITLRVVLQGYLPIFDFSILTADQLPAAPGYMPEPISTAGFALLALLLIAVIFKRFSRK